ncbi:hypothetical protein GCM10027051_32930 [Niabella terrae]
MWRPETRINSLPRPDLHNLIRHAAWKTVRQTLREKDARKDRTIMIGPDNPVNYKTLKFCFGTVHKKFGNPLMQERLS